MVKSFRNPAPVSASAVAAVLLSDTPPAVEGAPTAGAMAKASRGDHKHQRLSVTATGVLNGSGQATITFMREGSPVSFATKPAVTCMSIGATAAVIYDFTFTTDGNGNYTGGTLTGRKGQVLPTLPQLSLAALLTAVTTGVNALATALTSFNPFGGSASGVEYSFIAIGAS